MADHVSHYAYRLEPLQLESEYVVIGSGAGGATCAAQLARGGAQVTLIEAGAWRDPEQYPSSVYGTMRDLFDDWGSQVARGRALWPVVQASCVGGTTVINSAICVRTPEDIFTSWERAHGLSGLKEPVLRHQEAIEEELCASVVPSTSAGRGSELALLGAQRIGYESHIMTRYAKGCLGTGQCLQGCRSLRKQSLNLNYVPEVLARGGSVLSCAPAERILFQGRRAIGVRGTFRHPLTRRAGGRFEVLQGGRDDDGDRQPVMLAQLPAGSR